MKTCDNKNHWDMSKREFYDTVKHRKDELEEVIDKAKECKGYVDFDTWYMQEYEWRFLKDILGGQKQMGVAPFDYCNLIHVPVMTWKDAEGNEHRVKFMGEHDIEYYGLFSPYSFKDYGPDKTLTTDEEGNIVWATGSGTWGKIAGNVHDQTDVQARVIYSVSEPVEKYDNDIWVNEAEAGGGTGTLDYNMLHNKPSIAGVELTGNKTLEQLDLYSREEVNDKISSESATFRGTFYIDSEDRPESFDYDSYIKKQLEGIEVENNDYVIIQWKNFVSDRCKYNAKEKLWAFEYVIAGNITALVKKVYEIDDVVENDTFRKWKDTSSDKLKTTYSADKIDKMISAGDATFRGTYEATAEQIANADAFIKDTMIAKGIIPEKNDYVYLNKISTSIYIKYKYNLASDVWEYVIEVDFGVCDDTMSDTSSNPVQNKTIKGYVDGKISSLSTVAKTGNYNDLSNKPTIPHLYKHSVHYLKPNHFDFWFEVYNTTPTYQFDSYSKIKEYLKSNHSFSRVLPCGGYNTSSDSKIITGMDYDTTLNRWQARSALYYVDISGYSDEDFTIRREEIKTLF